VTGGGLANTRGTDDAVSLLRAELARRGYGVGELVHSYSGISDPRISYEDGNGTFPWATIPAAGVGTVTGAGAVFEVAVATISGPFTVSIDGAAATTFTPAGGAAAVQVFTVSGLSAGTHTATMMSTGGSLFPYAAGFRQSAGIVVENAGVSGTTAADWLAAPGWAAAGEFGPSWSLFHAGNVDHDLVVIELGVNDRWQAATVNTFRTNLAALVDRARGRGATVVLTASNSPGDASDGTPWSSYVAAVYDVADAKDLPLLDLTDRWGAFADYNADGTGHDLASDTAVHLTAAGNAAKMRAWLDLLTV
jgi:lysophospholipase L1-like esterase